MCRLGNSGYFVSASMWYLHVGIHLFCAWIRIITSLVQWIMQECVDGWGLIHWGRVTHICVGTLTIIGSDNGLSPSRRQAIIWTNDGLLLIGPLGKNFNEILIKILSFTFKKMRLKVSSAKWRPFCLDLNVLMRWIHIKINVWHKIDFHFSHKNMFHFDSHFNALCCHQYS